MTLERYRQKRDFRITPEPEGKVSRSDPAALSFVIQKHAASRLHYDFRLELNGVMLSWAVPKGPSLDPNDKRLAMHVEDHPMEYGGFEGVIPAKQYGAGTVMLWDRGVWLPKTEPNEAYAKGRLKFELDGEKLKGGWNLVRSRSAKYGDKSWLLFKETDEHARLGAQAQIVDELPASVATGRSLDEIAAQADRVWHSNRSVAANVESGAVGKTPVLSGLARIKGARKAPLPELVEAQLATLAKAPPAGAGWVHEVKYDGYRMLCRIADGAARMMSRTGKEWTAAFPTIVRGVARLGVREAWLDGEVVVVDARGRTSFQALQNVLSAESAANMSYFAFDLLYADGFDLRGVALVERKRLLHELLPDTPAALRYSDHFEAPGSAFLANVCTLGLEGMVSKRGDLPYQPGRGNAWIKVKCLRRQEMVIGGYTDPGGSRQGLGALLLGIYDGDGRLAYAGKVGTGFNDESLATLTRLLTPLRRDEPPFFNPPTGAEGRRARWVNPVLVAEVAFTEWTDDGTLRHPAFQGLRADKVATEVVREEPVSPPSVRDETRSQAQRQPASASKHPARPAKDTVAGIALTNAQKLLYAEAGITKRDLALYYQAVGEWMLPHLMNRPLTLVRCPNGWDADFFYQKNAEDAAPAAISRVRIEGGGGEASLYMMANSVSAIVGLLQMGALELHAWGSRAGSLGFPDRIIFDLDPDEAVAWEDIKQAALVVKTLLENIGLQAFLKTTGGKGLHVVVPIRPTNGWEEVKGFTKAVAELLERTFPDRFTSKLLKSSRQGRTFIDYLRNAEGATAIAAYSMRAKARAPVATPIAWSELKKDVRFDAFNIVNVPKRLAKLKSDPWAGIDDVEQSLARPLMARVGYVPPHAAR